MDVNTVMAQEITDRWALYNGDSAEVLPQMADASVDLAIFSPPFSSTYTYSPSDRDLGNVRSDDQFWAHFSFISNELLRVMRPGRLVAIHVANLPTYANKHGASGRSDFRGETIRHFVKAGFVYHSEVTIDKNPQAQAIRTHSKGLLFVQMRRDAAALWQAWADYLVVMRTPGENKVPVLTELDEETWIDWARPVWPGMPDRNDNCTQEWTDWLGQQVWYGIRETDVLGAAEGREHDDERHLCPLQLPVIERAVRLWSNPDEVVLSPFAGIGSEGVGSLRNGRRFVGIELKPAYYSVAVRNLRKVGTGTPSLFSDRGRAEL